MKLQNKNHTIRDVIVVGFALFAMFFGAGNVISRRTSVLRQAPTG